MKYIGIAGVLIVIIAIFLISEKLYPVAIVNESLIGKRTWERYLNGANHALILQAQRDNQHFDIDADTLTLLKKSTLMALIEDRIIAQNAVILIPDFAHSSEQYITTAIGTSTTLSRAAQFMYGFGEKDFHDFVLLPESRREVVRHWLEQKQLNYDAWLAGAKKKARVYILINGYIWDGNEVK